MKEFGEYLRSERLARGITLEEIEGRTRIRRRHLNAIESGEFHRLPEEPYVRAFLRHYATCVGLDPSAVLEQYEQVIGSSAAGEIAAASSTGRSERRMKQLRARRRRRVWQWIVLFLILAVLASLAYSDRLRGWLDSVPGLISRESATRLEDDPTFSSVDSSFPDPLERSQPVVISEEPALQNVVDSDSPEPAVREEPVVEPARADDLLEAANEESALPGLASSIDWSTDPVRVPGAGSSSTFVLGLVARQTSWAELHVDGERVLYRNLEPDEELTYEVQNEAYLRLGRASDVVLYINGDEVGSIGTGVVSRRLLHVHPNDVRLESE